MPAHDQQSHKYSSIVKFSSNPIVNSIDLDLSLIHSCNCQCSPSMSLPLHAAGIIKPIKVKLLCYRVPCKHLCMKAIIVCIVEMIIHISYIASCFAWGLPRSNIVKPQWHTYNNSVYAIIVYIQDQFQVTSCSYSSDQCCPHTAIAQPKMDSRTNFLIGFSFLIALISIVNCITENTNG